MVWVTGWRFNKIFRDCLKTEGRTFCYERKRASRSKTEKRFNTIRKVQERNGERGEDKRNENGDEEKGFWI